MAYNFPTVPIKSDRRGEQNSRLTTPLKHRDTVTVRQSVIQTHKLALTTVRNNTEETSWTTVNFKVRTVQHSGKLQNTRSCISECSGLVCVFINARRIQSQQQLGAANQTHWIRSLVSVTTSLAVCSQQHVGVCQCHWSGRPRKLTASSNHTVLRRNCLFWKDC